MAGRSGPRWSSTPRRPRGSTCEEVFGPVVTVTPFETEDEAVALANDTRFGLNAMLSPRTSTARTGWPDACGGRQVWVNCFFVRDLRAPFGGVGDSGVGREGGDHSREFMTDPKAVVMEVR